MELETYNKIVFKLSQLNTREEQIKYLLDNIEQTDYENNGLNDMLVKTLKDLRDKKCWH